MHVTLIPILSHDWGDVSCSWKKLDQSKLCVCPSGCRTCIVLLEQRVHNELNKRQRRDDTAHHVSSIVQELQGTLEQVSHGFLFSSSFYYFLGWEFSKILFFMEILCFQYCKELLTSGSRMCIVLLERVHTELNKWQQLRGFSIFQDLFF